MMSQLFANVHSAHYDDVIAIRAYDHDMSPYHIRGVFFGTFLHKRMIVKSED